jgi:hypothetical protein
MNIGIGLGPQEERGEREARVGIDQEADPDVK